jgi:hypothetical protein
MTNGLSGVSHPDRCQCLAEQHLQRLARSHHTHPQRAFRCAHDFCHLLVGEILDVLEKECFPLGIRQPREGAVQHFPQGGALEIRVRVVRRLG